MSPLARPSVPELQPLVDAFYAFPENGVGGVLHIVLDDGNLDNDSLLFCIESAHSGGHLANPTPGGPDEAGELLGRLLLLCSMTQRRKIYRTRGLHRMDRSEFIARCRELLSKYELLVPVSEPAAKYPIVHGLISDDPDYRGCE